MTTLLIVFAAIIAVFLGYTLVAPNLSYLPQFSRAFEVWSTPRILIQRHREKMSELDLPLDWPFPVNSLLYLSR